MAITDKEQGVWGLEEVYNKINQGSIWDYDGSTQLFTFGWNSKGQLGNNENGDSGGNYSSPVQVPGTTWNALSTWVSGDSWHSLASKTDGTLWVWGGNAKGELGLNNTTQYSSPVQLPGTTWGTELRSGQEASYALKTDGSLWSWGDNSPSYGELGHNNKTNYSSPKQVGTDTTWSNITTMGYGCIAKKTDGTLWTWGADSQGMLGQNGGGAISSPKQVGTDTTWTGDITGGMQFGAAIKTDGALWMWGVNEYGMLAQNSLTKYSSPRQVGTDTTWSNISSTMVSVAAVKTDGTLWTWGFGGEGRLGHNQGEPSQYSSPVQIPGTTWSRVQGGGYNMYATKTDGTLWAWGSGNQGQLGNNNQVNQSSPIQVPGSWKSEANKIGTNYIGASAISNT